MQIAWLTCIYVPITFIHSKWKDGKEIQRDIGRLFMCHLPTYVFAEWKKNTNAIGSVSVSVCMGLLVAAQQINIG